jgi:hypothetical protein
MEETKTIYVVLSYSMSVPKEMTEEQIQEALYDRYQAQSDSSVNLSVTDDQTGTESVQKMDLFNVFSGESIHIVLG